MRPALQTADHSSQLLADVQISILQSSFKLLMFCGFCALMCEARDSPWVTRSNAIPEGSHRQRRRLHAHPSSHAQYMSIIGDFISCCFRFQVPASWEPAAKLVSEETKSLHGGVPRLTVLSGCAASTL